MDAFLDSGFEESVTYGVDGGSESTFDAVVIPSPPGSGSVNGSTIVQYKFDVWIARANIANVKLNADYIKILRNGKTFTYKIRAILAEDKGCFKLGVA